MKRLLTYILMVVLLTDCAKEKTYSECDTLSELFSPTGYVPGQTYSKQDSTQFMRASINPVNPDEVVYYGGKHPNWHMYVYNVASKQRTKISNLSPNHNIKWHKSGWLTFTAADNNVYVLKANGDSLTQLTTSGDCFYPEWNSIGDKIICYRGYQYFAEGNNYLIDKHTKEKIIIKLNDGGINICSWSGNDSSILWAAWNEIWTTSYPSGNSAAISFTRPLRSSIMGACWMPDGKHALWCPDSKPEILDTETGISTALLPLCEKMQYSYPSVTADGRYALFNLNIGGYIGYNTTQTKERLSVIDLTTNTETILDLPE